MFYFDYNTFEPLKCPELAFWKADVYRVTFCRLFFYSPSVKEHTFSIAHVLFSFSLKTHGFLVTIHGIFTGITVLKYL